MSDFRGFSQTKVLRGFSEVLALLDSLHTGEHKHDAVIDALIWGYSSARTSERLERHLYDLSSVDLAEKINAWTASWDGQDWLSGALRHCQTHA